MNDKPKILFVVEGQDDEAFVSRMCELFEFKASIYTVRANIYALYQKVKDDLFADTQQVLLEMRGHESDKSVLGQEYTDIFLVFDCDPHHTFGRDDANALPLKERFARNMGIIKKMVERFNESTDPQKGKLLINYPMLESFRDCDEFFDQKYADAEVKLEDVCVYKRKVGLRGLVRYHIRDYSRSNMLSLIKQNVCKLNKLLGGEFASQLYNVFLAQNSQIGVADSESTLINKRECISVLNTLLFFPIEYMGEKLYMEIIPPPTSNILLK